MPYTTIGERSGAWSVSLRYVLGPGCQQAAKNKTDNYPGALDARVVEEHPLVWTLCSEDWRDLELQMEEAQCRNGKIKIQMVSHSILYGNLPQPSASSSLVSRSKKLHKRRLPLSKINDLDHRLQRITMMVSLVKTRPECGILGHNVRHSIRNPKAAWSQQRVDVSSKTSLLVVPSILHTYALTKIVGPAEEGRWKFGRAVELLYPREELLPLFLCPFHCLQPTIQFLKRQ